MKTIGLDIGGSHISGAELIISDRDFQVGPITEKVMDTSRTKEDLILDWASLVRSINSSDSDIRLGIAMPGPFDYENGISLIKEQGKMKSLYGLSIKLMLAEELEIPIRNIHFVNDAEAFLLGEKYAGELKGFDKIMGITLGTGLGSAIGIENVVKDAKLWSSPFKDGIAEDYLGNAWFVKEAQRRFGTQVSGVRDILSWTDQSRIQNIFTDLANTLSEFLLPYLIRIQAEGLVLGGKISLAHEYFLPRLLENLKKFDCQTEIKISKLGEKAALIGAILPCLSQFNNEEN
ncbi:ROK family protein [Algoriphagus sediminis]|uniref:ROK family protein n=1 Tax=Algoriphagus sediminis TaxID=3057113 RepID=A0ABT7Y818_9BACT|nr:ROK family protein [Algoriphagus sediminis]MDN3202615.1 ROK family protein [Algoriphagus sediminis]